METIPNLIAKVQAVLKNSGISTGNSSYIVGVSGGADSMVLLHLLAVELNLKVTAAHVNYRIRGDDSEADEQLVKSYCNQFKIPFEYLDAKSTNIIEVPAGNFQDRAREIRRQFFLSVMDRKNADAIILAHHRDDQIETIVQKILRGAAIENWAGMKPVDMPWVRPLLDFTKSELLSYVEAIKIPYRTDTSNLESDYARNLLRNEIFPRLEGHFPGWQQNLIRLSEFSTLHRSLLDYVTDEVTFGDSTSGPGEMTLMRLRWLGLTENLKVPVARHWIQRSVGYISWSRGAVLRLNDLEHLETGGRIIVSEKVTILRDRSRFVIQSGPKKNEPYDIATRKKSDGNAEGGNGLHFPVKIRMDALHSISGEPVHTAGYTFANSVYRPEKLSGILQLRMKTLTGKNKVYEGKEPVEKSLNHEERIMEELILRPWKNGDRFQPLGLDGYQTVADHLTNRKISSAEKKDSLVLESCDGKILAVIYPHPLHNDEIGSIAEYARCQFAGEPVLLIKKGESPDF